MDRDLAYTLTGGLSRAAAEAHLREREHGVLSLAGDDEAYAIPVNHHLEDGTLLFRLGLDPDSDKRGFLETTATATYVVYAAEETPDQPGQTAWSVVARGPIREVPADHPLHEALAVNERFPPIRLFDEAVEDVDVALYALEIQELTGRES